MHLKPPFRFLTAGISRGAFLSCLTSLLLFSCAPTSPTPPTSETFPQEISQEENIFLTIQLPFQKASEESLINIEEAAVVFLDAKNGDILALVSQTPTTSSFIAPLMYSANWSEFNSTPHLALRAFAPGTAFLPVTAIAGLRQHLITPSTWIEAPGKIQIDGKEFADWNPEGHGPLTVDRGLALASTTYFYQLGLRIGIEPIARTAHDLGLGCTSELPIKPDDPGVIPDANWLKSRESELLWSDAHTANASVGAGDVTATPLQMAVMMSAIANGGTVYYPRLIDSIRTRKGTIKSQFSPARVRSRLYMTEIDLQAIRSGLTESVKIGSRGVYGNSPESAVAGRTGATLSYDYRNGSRTKFYQYWFAGYYPAGQPRYSFCVLVRSRRQSGNEAVPVAIRIVRQIESNQQETVEKKPRAKTPEPLPPSSPSLPPTPDPR